MTPVKLLLGDNKFIFITDHFYNDQFQLILKIYQFEDLKILNNQQQIQLQKGLQNGKVIIEDVSGQYRQMKNIIFNYIEKKGTSKGTGKNSKLQRFNCKARAEMLENIKIYQGKALRVVYITKAKQYDYQYIVNELIDFSNIQCRIYKQYKFGHCNIWGLQNLINFRECILEMMQEKLYIWLVATTRVLAVIVDQTPYSFMTLLQIQINQKYRK